MNDNTKIPRKPGRFIGLIVLAAVLTAVAAYALQILFLGETSASVSGGASAAVAVITAIGLRSA